MDSHPDSPGGSRREPTMNALNLVRNALRGDGWTGTPNVGWTFTDNGRTASVLVIRGERAHWHVYDATNAVVASGDEWSITDAKRAALAAL